MSSLPFAYRAFESCLLTERAAQSQVQLHLHEQKGKAHSIAKMTKKGVCVRIASYNYP